MPTETVLLTGLPTLLARRVAERLLSGSDSRIVAVVRQKFLDEAGAFREELPEGLRERLTLLEGDAAAMDLGLSGLEYLRLAREVDVIHHAAQVSYMGVDERAADVNVRGAREAIELARAADHLRVLVHYSTAYVSGDRRGVVLEGELDKGQKPRNVVEATKLRAEKLVRAATDVRSVVLRPSTIVGDSRTGEVDRLDGPYLLVLLLLTTPVEVALPFPTFPDARMHLVPVDWVAAASVAIANDARAVGQTFHLVDPDPPTVRRVAEMLAQATGRREPRGFIPANLARAILGAPGLDRIARSPRAFLDQLGTDVRFDARNAQALLSGTGLVVPAFDAYVDALVQHVRQRLADGRRREDARAEAEDPLS